jgi:hypothetical protein
MWCGADTYCDPVDSYISINVGRITQTISDICIDCWGLRYPTNFELLNTISATGLRLRLHGWAHLPALPNSPISRCIHLTTLHSSHLMTCGRISYLIQPPAPVCPKTQRHRTGNGECLHSRKCQFLKQMLDSRTIAADVHAESSLAGC